MKTSAVSQPQATIIWLLVILAILCAAQEQLHTLNLDCYNDYITEMFCTWNVSNIHTNCSHVFLLEYNYRRKRTSYCVPENVQLSDPSSPPECICHISVESFVAADIYYIQVRSRGGSSHNKTIVPVKKVKPKTPVNVTIEHAEDATGIVRWDSRYTDSDFLFHQLIFEVQTSTIQEPKEVNVTTLHQVDSCYVIKKRLLRRGQNYTIQVRSKPNGIDYNGVWSEWSSAAVWHNDYDLQFHEIMLIAIPSSASVIFICIFLCSACTCYCKKWLKTIPDPGRSQLLFTLMNTSQGPVLHSGNNLPFMKRRKYNKIICSAPAPQNVCARPCSQYFFGFVYCLALSFSSLLKGICVCGKWLKMLSKNIGETNPNSANLITAGHLHCFNSKVKQFFVVPERTIVEQSVDITPLDTHSANEPAEEVVDEARDLGMECDFINQMFLEILDGGKGDVMEMDDADSLEKQAQSRFIALSDVCFQSALQTTSELVPTGYKNWNLPINTSQNIFCFDEKLGNQRDFPGYSPAAYTDYTPSPSIDTYMEYNSFACEEQESRESEEPKCLQTISSRNGTYHKTEPTWLMPYTGFNNCQIKPLSDHYHPIEQKDTTSSTEVTSGLYQVSDYQSFDTAIGQQGKSV